MSLSKYFKDSSSFKREEIVKSSPDRSQGWHRETEAESAPFEREQSISRQDNATKQALPAEPVTSSIVKEQQPSEPSPPPTTAPATPPVDLSKYVTTDEAEARSQESYQTGFQEGLQKAAEDYSSATNAFSTSCHQLDSIRETIINNSSHELLQFSLLIAEKILRISLKEQDETIVATIEEALHRAVKSDEFTIFIHPDDYETISRKSEELISGVSGLSNIVLKTDSTLEKGGAKIESENCIIDATVSSQFETIREELFPREKPENPPAES